MSESFSLISTTFLKGLLWWCIEKSTKALKRQCVEQGLKGSWEAGSSNTNWSLQNNSYPTYVGISMLTTQPHINCCYMWRPDMQNFPMKAKTRTFIGKSMKCWLLRQTDKQRNTNLITSPAVTTNLQEISVTEEHGK